MRAILCLALLTAILAGGCAGPSRQQLLNEASNEFYLGQVDRASQSLDQLAKRYPADPEVRYLQGRVAHAQQAWPQALYYYSAALDAAPWHDRARTWRARAERESGLKASTLRFVP